MRAQHDGLLEVVVTGPDLSAVSGISTHVSLLLASPLAESVRLRHVRAGSEGRSSSPARQVARLAWTPLALLGVLLLRRPDVVHVNSATERKALWRDLVLLLVARLCARRTVLQLHGGPHPQALADASRADAAALRLALRLAGRVVLLASVERDAYASFAPGIDTIVVPNAIALPPPPRTARRTLRDGGPLRLLYVGRLARAKGLFESAEAVAALVQRGVPCSWTVAGSGPDEEALRQAVAALALQDHVHLVGPVFGADKQALWDEHDVLLFPTWHREGLPYALLEGMAAGVLPISCPVGGIPDVVRDGEHGLLVPIQDARAVTDALVRIHEDREQAAAMAEAARARVEQHYSLDRLARQLGEVYADLCRS